MTDEPRPIRLRAPGMGVVAGGIGVILASAILTPLFGAIVIVAIAIAYALAGPEHPDPRRIGVGVGLVGVIALIEASPIGIRFDPVVIGLAAIAFGMFDIVVGLVFTERVGKA